MSSDLLTSKCPSWREKMCEDERFNNKLESIIFEKGFKRTIKERRRGRSIFKNFDTERGRNKEALGSDSPEQQRTQQIEQQRDNIINITFAYDTIEQEYNSENQQQEHEEEFDRIQFSNTLFGGFGFVGKNTLWGPIGAQSTDTYEEEYKYIDDVHLRNRSPNIYCFNSLRYR